MELFWNWEVGRWPPAHRGSGLCPGGKSEGGHFRAINADYGLQKIMGKNRFFKEVKKSNYGKETQKDPQRTAQGTR
jgi:hypothetical protein